MKNIKLTLTALSFLIVCTACATGSSQKDVADALPYQLDDQGWITLFNGEDLSGWRLMENNRPNYWSVQNGILSNIRPKDTDIQGANLYTEQTFGDCQLHVEFMVPKGSNSGVFLQSRYEVQVYDSYGRDPSTKICGALYGKVAPLVNAAKPAGEWQTFDVLFRQPKLGPNGKVVKPLRMTVYHNGIKVIENAALRKPTGGPIPHKPIVTPAPLLLQGDHGSVYFKDIRIHPLNHRR